VQREFIGLISGKRRGLAATLMRFGLRGLSFWYWLAVNLRLAAYAMGLPRRRRVNKPVLCIGNLTTGGTGKTPAVAWAVNTLRELDAKPAIVSRGYKAAADGNDEMKVLAELCPGVLHLQNRDRVKAASEASSQGADVIVLDDGFSHLRLWRDLDVLLLDSLNPFGYGRMLPRGLMREPLRSMRRAGAIVFTRADVATPERLRELEDVVKCYGFTGPICHAAHVPVKLLDVAGGVDRPLEFLRELVVAPFCGIGNPRGFERTLESCGAKISPLGTLVLDDHAPLDAREITRQLQPFLRASLEQGAKAGLCTQKDAVKLRGQDICPGVPCYELRVEFRILRGEQELRDKMRALLPSKL
jgi:tetraacyldisaccharide 4'-kinase